MNKEKKIKLNSMLNDPICPICKYLYKSMMCRDLVKAEHLAEYQLDLIKRDK